MARLTGLAFLTCAGPNVDITYTPRAGATPAQTQQFDSRILVLEGHAASILNERATLGALVTGEVGGTAVFTPAPLVEIKQSLQAMINTDTVGQLGLSPECLPYAIPHIEEAGHWIQVVGANSAIAFREADSLAALF